MTKIAPQKTGVRDGDTFKSYQTDRLWFSKEEKSERDNKRKEKSKEHKKERRWKENRNNGKVQKKFLCSSVLKILLLLYVYALL